jgi:pseudaminic acid synthase
VSVSNRQVDIGGVAVGDSAPMFVIAELSANHQHDLSVALRTIEAAAEAGANAVKLQTYTADTITFPSDRECFRVTGGTIWDGRTLYELYEEAYTPWEWHEQLFDTAANVGLVCFSSPFDPTAVEFLAGLNAPAYKIASFEITDIPLIRLTAGKGKPIIMSTGIATEPEIADAVRACHEVGNHDVILLKCTSAYPALLEDMNLNTIPDMRARFDTLVGLSDHSPGHLGAVAAVPLGACVLEKHIILDRSLGGPDAAFSMTPGEFAEMVAAVRSVESALGVATYELPDRARVSRSHSRSLFVVQNVSAGDPVTATNVRSIRPANGLPPVALDRLGNAIFTIDVDAGTPLEWEMLADVEPSRDSSD